MLMSTASSSSPIVVVDYDPGPPRGARRGYDADPLMDYFEQVAKRSPTSGAVGFDAFYDNMTDVVAGGNVFVDDHVVPSPGLSDDYQRALIVLYSVTTSLAVLGNLIVIGVLVVGRRSKNDLRAFLLNLAVADLTMAVFCMPFTFTTTMLHDWVFGSAMCTIVLFLQMMSVTASVGTSTAIAVTRYVVVIHPLKRHHVGRHRSRLAIIASVWIASVLLSSVQLMIGRAYTVSLEHDVQVTFCTEVWPEDGADTWRTAYTFFVLATTYLLPLSIIAPAYACVVCRLWQRRVPGNVDRTRDGNQLRSTRRVIKMLSVMVSLFAVCWLPLHAFTVVVDFVPSLRSEDNAAADGTIVAVYTAVHWLAMSNSFVNPIVYGFLNDGFRADLRYLVSRCFGLHVEADPSSPINRASMVQRNSLLRLSVRPDNNGRHLIVSQRRCSAFDSVGEEFNSPDSVRVQIREGGVSYCKGSRTNRDLANRPRNL